MCARGSAVDAVGDLRRLREVDVVSRDVARDHVLEELHRDVALLDLLLFFGRAPPDDEPPLGRAARDGDLPADLLRCERRRRDLLGDVRGGDGRNGLDARLRAAGRHEASDAHPSRSRSRLAARSPELGAWSLRRSQCPPPPFTSLTSEMIVFFASPSTIIVFGRKKSSFSTPEKPVFMLRFSTITLRACSTLKTGMP